MTDDYPFAFTIAVAACNVEPYLQSAIQSVERQTFSDFELLFTCEQSDDRTIEICRQYVSLHSNNCRIVEFPRSGSASICRNYAMEHARGKYLIFLDGDDWIDPDSLSRFTRALKEAQEPDMLMVKMDQYWLQPDGTQIPGNIVFANFGQTRSLRSGLQVLCDLNRELLTLQGMTPLNIYRTAFLRKNSSLRQIPKVWLEDLEWIIRVFFFARSVASLDFIYYHYVKRKNSKTTAHNDQGIFDVALVLNSIADFYTVHRLEIPASAAGTYAKVFMHLFFWCFLSPRNDRRSSPHAKRQALAQCIAAPERFQHFYALAQHGPPAKRLFLPLIWLARFKGGHSILFFIVRNIYFPLCESVNDLKRAIKK